MTNIRTKLNKEIIEKLPSLLGVANVWALPRLQKIVVNVGLGRLVAQSAKPDEIIKRVEKELIMITGQKPIVTKAKKAIASFKTREGMPIGMKVTLHGQRMYDFLERVINVALPRTRDFRGLETSCVDDGGNLTVGIKDHTVFSEASADAAHTFGLEFTAVVASSDKKNSFEFFKMLGFPFKK